MIGPFARDRLVSKLAACCMCRVDGAHVACLYIWAYAYISLSVLVGCMLAGTFDRPLKTPCLCARIVVGHHFGGRSIIISLWVGRPRLGFEDASRYRRKTRRRDRLWISRVGMAIFSQTELGHLKCAASWNSQRVAGVVP